MDDGRNGRAIGDGSEEQDIGQHGMRKDSPTSDATEIMEMTDGSTEEPSSTLEIRLKVGNWTSPMRVYARLVRRWLSALSSHFMMACRGICNSFCSRMEAGRRTLESWLEHSR